MGHKKLIDLPKVTKLEVPQAEFESRTLTINHYILLPLGVMETNWRQSLISSKWLERTLQWSSMTWEKHRLGWYQKGLVCQVTQVKILKIKSQPHCCFLLFVVVVTYTTANTILTHASFLLRHNGKISFFIIIKIILRFQQPTK